MKKTLLIALLATAGMTISHSSVDALIFNKKRSASAENPELQRLQEERERLVGERKVAENALANAEISDEDRVYYEGRLTNTDALLDENMRAIRAITHEAMPDTSSLIPGSME